MGQGMITVLSQIISQELGIDYKKVNMAPADTSRLPDSGPTVASRTTMFSGRAIQDACKKLRVIMFDTIASKLENHNLDLRIKDQFIENENGQVLLSVKEAIKLMHDERVQVAAVGWDVAPDTYYDYEKGEGKPNVAYAWGTTIVEVEVDVLTGVCEVTDVWAVYDVGKAINPQTVEAQIEGGVLQGLGYGRYEEVIFSDIGSVLTNTYGTYMIPSVMDSPRIHTFIVEDPWDEGPYGAKGIGELPLVGVAPAITSAIYNAIGVRLNEIPVTPERVWNAIQEQTQEDLQ
jgi:CO/xanthine dehydrogenase Mo-binding subunit